MATNLPLPPDYARHMPTTPSTGPGTPAETPELPELDTSEDGITELDDGDVMIALKDAEDDAPATDAPFDENLVGVLDRTLLNQLARQLLDDCEVDKEARSKRDEQYAEGIKRTGMGKEAPGGANFTGASTAVHPVLTEACIDFSTRTMKEIFPAGGPCKIHVVGKSTRDKLARAQRKRDYMNWQLTTQIKEYQRELGVLMTQIPLGGSGYMKWRYDPSFERARPEFVAVDNLLVPFEATSIYTASRVTHVMHINRMEYDSRVESGLYADAAVGEPTGTPERTASEQAAAKAEGVQLDLNYNNDGLRTVYESHIYLPLGPAGEGEPGEDELAKRRMMPYIFTVDAATGQPLALYRNWDEEDQDKQEKLDWIVDHTFLLWRGAQGVGLAHIIGSLSGAATGALRALLDSAHVANHPSALKLKGIGSKGQTVQADPGTVVDIDAPPATDDIRKVVMPHPFPGPSPVLFQLLEYVVQQAKGVVTVATEALADSTPNIAMGTALAIIEQGSNNFADIHRRQHEAQALSLQILHRINRKHLRDHEVVEELGELVVSREDFEGPTDIVPVSDPNIYSEGQRYAQIQAVFQLAQMAPGLYDMVELHRRALNLMRVSDADELLMAPGEPEERGALEENACAHDPKCALKAYPEQDHLSHLKAHVTALASPILGLNSLMALPASPKLLEHCKEHLVALYRQHALAAQHAVMEGAPDVAKDTDTAAAEAAGFVDATLAQELAPIMQALMQAQQQIQQMLTAQQQPQEPPQVTAARLREQGAAQRQQLELSSRQQTEMLHAQLQQALAQMEQQAAVAGQQHEAVLTQITASMQQQLEQQTQTHAQALEADRQRHATELEALRGVQAEERAQAAEQFQQMLQAQKAGDAERMAALQAGFAQQLEQLRAELQMQVKSHEVKVDPPAPPAPAGKKE